VLVLSDSMDREYTERAKEVACFKQVMNIMKKRKFVGLLAGGAKDLIRYHLTNKVRLGFK